MGSLWFLKLALNCIDHLAWPLLALGYPLCASIQAIETDFYSETRDLISYWILLSLIYLFEYAFLRLLQWFLFWPYVKLMIIFWLIVPDFGRAFYVYNKLIRSCISMKPQAVISRLKNRRKLFVEKENFLLQAERYVKENGTEALEKLIVSKNTMHNPDAEATNAIRANDMKEMQQNTMHNPDAEATNTIRANDMKEMQQNTMHNPDAEATNAIRANDMKEMQQNTMRNPDAEATNVIRANDMKEMQQKEHFVQTNEKRHQAEHKDIKDLEVIDKKEIPAGKQDIPVMPNLAFSQNTSSVIVETKGMAGKDAASGELPQSSTHKEVQKEWTCAVCQVTTTSEQNLNSHLHGRKHKAACEALKTKNQPVPRKLKNDQSKEKNIINQHANIEQKNIKISHAKEYAQTGKVNNFQKGVHAPANKTDHLNGKTENGESIVNHGLKGKVVMDHGKVQKLQNNLGKPVGMNASKLRCEVCNVRCTSVVDMASHLNGKKHLAQIQNLGISTPFGSKTNPVQRAANVGGGEVCRLIV